jgi:hypothetical protein
MMPRFARSFVALAAAYGVLGALFIGSISAGRAAASPAPLCSALKTAGDGDSAPLPVSRDLSCLVSGCCGCTPPDFAPVTANSAPPRAKYQIVWWNFPGDRFKAEIENAFSARAPPARV